jgi:ribosomal protein S18 acetylase RimI-like enzyme
LSYEYRQARPDDLEGIARVFSAAFPESLAHYFDRAPAPAVVAEPFALCLASEPEGLLVADAGQGAIAGYIFAPAHTRRIPWVAVTRGFLFQWFWRWVTGHYNIGLSPVRALAVNKVDFLTSDRQTDVPDADARILSIAVHPEHQGRGVAGELCRLGLGRLDRLGAHPVRLEVRPGNTPAVRLYSRLGFQVSGRTRDAQGEWLIMLRHLPV